MSDETAMMSDKSRSAGRAPVRLLLAAAFLAAWAAAGLNTSLASNPTTGPDATVPAAATPDPSPFVRRVQEHTRWLGSYPTRLLGTAGHEAAVTELARRIDELAARHGLHVWRHGYEVIVPRTMPPLATMTEHVGLMRIRTGQNAGEHAIYPIWPATVRANTTPAEGLEGDLVYVGQGSYAELLPRSLRGQIAVMEMTGGANWQSAYTFGARAILLLGSEGETQAHAHRHLTRLPLNVPRFYVPAGDLADRLRAELAPLAEALRSGQAVAAERIPRARLHARVHFVPATATNLYVLVNPAGTEAPGRSAIAVAAAYDSTGIVPDLAGGADAAVDAATLLAALEHFAQPAHRPARPVLFAFVDAYTFNQVGPRQMMLALAATEKDRNLYADEDRRLVQEYGRYAAQLDELGSGPEAMNRLYLPRYGELHRYLRDEVSREVVAIEAELHPIRLRKAEPGLSQEERDRLSEKENRLAAKRLEAYAAQLQLLTDKPVQEGVAGLAGKLWGQVCYRVRGQHADVRARLAMHDERARLQSELRGLLGIGASEPVLGFLLGLDLSDGGVSVGPRLYCNSMKLNESGNARDFIRWLRGFEDKKGNQTLWTGRAAGAVNLAPLRGTSAPETFSVGDVANLTHSGSSFGLAAATWATLDCYRQRVDTALDRVERLDWSRLAGQIDATRTLLDRMVRRTDFAPSATSAAAWSRVSGVIVDQSPGEPVPRVPMQGYVTALVHGASRASQISYTSRPKTEGCRLDEYVLTGADGMFYFEGQLGGVGIPTTSHIKFVVQSYLLGDDGRIVRAVDLNKVGKGVRLDVTVTEKRASPRRAVVFTCDEANALGLFDPRFLLNLPYGTLLDARRAGRPQRMNFALYDGQMSALLEPETRWQVILRAGSVENRMAMVNTLPADESAGLSMRQMMRGFDVGQPLPASPMELAVRDFYRLDERRIDEHARAGVRSKAIDDIHARTERGLAEAADAVRRNDGLALFRAASGALSNEVRAYQAVRSLANDVIRAAIFLLLALVPFSFAMERLLFASPRVYRQLAGILGIFTVMAAVLWSFHPAFRISSQPLMIIMAFAIIFMSLLVMSIVYQRFKSQLEEMRSGRAEASGARTSRGGLAASAVRLGIANMRKRRLRTTLTGSTVMLITFALLCFTSVSSYIGHTERRLSTQSPYAGLLIRQPQNRVMPEKALTVVQAAIPDAVAVAPQYWWANALSPDWRVRVSTLPAPTGGAGASANANWVRNDIAVNAALGLAPAEHALTGIGDVLGHWTEFVEHGGCYLESETADPLLAVPDSFEPMPVELKDHKEDSEPVRRDKEMRRRQWRLERNRRWIQQHKDRGQPIHVMVAGRAVRVVNVFDNSEMLRIRAMTGESLMPTNYSIMGEEQRQLLAQQSQDQLIAEMASGAGLEAEQQLPPLQPADVVIVPASMLVGLPNASLRSIAVQTRTLDEARKAADEMANRVAFPIYFGSPEEVHVMASTALAPQGPKSLVIMLVIAGLIIFNTMLNSIAERKKEVHIYSSLGLAPMHIGVLFLAEAATYGLMGAIFGYIVGQGVATGLTHLGLLGGITLNYSGTQAIATMLMVLAVVVISALVPAYMAGKLAAPSDVMKWTVPKPVGDVIRDTLPFTVTDQTANGVAMFLHDYLDAHREGSIGHFSTDNLRLDRRRVDGMDLLAVESTVWLAPYDLGVRQDVRLTIVETGEKGVLQIEVELRRGAGQPPSWWRLNRVFLGDLRKQLLGWRKLKTARVLEYISAGGQALAGMGG